MLCRVQPASGRGPLDNVSRDAGAGAGARLCTCRRRRRRVVVVVAAQIGASVGLGAAPAPLRVPGARSRQARAGERLAYRLDRLGGAYLKAGQVLSTRSTSCRTRSGLRCVACAAA